MSHEYLIQMKLMSLYIFNASNPVYCQWLIKKLFLFCVPYVCFLSLQKNPKNQNILELIHIIHLIL